MPPSERISIRGDFHSTDNGSSYTAITPHTQEATHFVMHVHPLEKLTIEDEVSVANNKRLVNNFQNIRWSGRLIAAGLIVQMLTLLATHPLAFICFALIGCPLVGAGIILFLYSLVAHETV